MNDLITLYQQIDHHLQEDQNPENYLNHLTNAIFDHQYPFTLLQQLKTTDQSPKYHPEGTVWNHTMMVVSQAARRKQQSHHPRTLMWAAFLHDIGKPKTSTIKKGRITSHQHDQVGAEEAKTFLSYFEKDTLFIEAVVALVRWHMQPFYVTHSLPYSDIESMMKQCDLNDLILLGLCDRLGRGGVNPKKEMILLDQFIRQIQPYIET